MSSYYHNPVIHADYADPDVIRTGEDFWMVSSSFNQVPGIPVLHSRDLIHWRIASYVLPRIPLAEYDTVQPGKGVWAPSIRYHDGRFWVFFSIPDSGIFVCHARDPQGGWSEPRCLKAVAGWIDPCPFWDDDGRAWLVHAFAYSRTGIKNQLQLLEMAPDASWLADQGRIIFDGTLSHPTLEGPKLYKYRGMYWIFAPAGGVKRGWQTVLRAAHLEGPWETRDVLHQGDTPVNGPHQGGWVALENGEHWFMHFQDKGVYGRVIHLQPMRWQDDGWPALGEPDGHGSGVPVLTHLRPGLPPAPQTLPASDDFVDGRPGLQWQWQANPRTGWLLDAGDGLHLRCAPVGRWQGQPTLYATPQLLLQKFPAARFRFTVRIGPAFTAGGDEGGIILYGERYTALCITEGDAGRQLVLRHGWMSDKGMLQESVRVVAEVPPGAGVVCECQVGHDGTGLFRYALDGAAWQTVHPGFSSAAGKWIGARMGVYALSWQGSSPGHVVFDDFQVQPG